MDMTSSLEAKSDQLNAVDLTEARTFTIEKVTAGNADQPFNFHLVELPGKPWRPSKGMRRVLARGWGAKNIESVYPGRRVTLFCEPSVKWAGADVGGIRVSHLSDVGEGFSTPLALSAKQRIMYRVEPLAAAAAPAPAPVSLDGLDIDALKALWKQSNAETRKAIEDRVAELAATETSGES
jgi:hypothetical protein